MLYLKVLAGFASVLVIKPTTTTTTAAITTSRQVDVLADLRPPEPPFGLAIVQSVKTSYFSQYKACQSLGIKPQVRY